MRQRKQEKTAILIIGDLTAMLVSFVLALYVGYRTPAYLGLLLKYPWALATLLASSLVVFVILDIYSLHKMPTGLMNTMIIIALGLAISAAITTFVFFFFRDPIPRAVFILFYLFAWILIALFRYLNSRVTRAQIYWKVLLVGEHDLCGELIGLIANRTYLHTRIVGYLSPSGSGALSDTCPWLGPVNSLLSVLKGIDVDQVIVAKTTLEPELMNDLLSAMKRKIKVSDHKQMIEEITGKVPIDHLSDTWFIEELASVERRYYWYLKRALDIIFAGTGIVVSLPMILISSLMIKLDSKGSAFYSQTRIGRGGVPFRVWKLRTMVADADKSNVFWTTDNDERIMRVGKVLRKLHIDEFPQFLNILKGDMTLIGPRPEATALVDLYTKEIPYYQERHMVTPGVTGWAQINFPYGNSVDDTREKLKYDFYYIKNRSILLDLLILLRTIRTVVTGKGAL